MWYRENSVTAVNCTQLCNRWRFTN